MTDLKKIIPALPKGAAKLTCAGNDRKITIDTISDDDWNRLSLEAGVIDAFRCGKRTSENAEKAARMLGWSKSKFYRKLKAYEEAGHALGLSKVPIKRPWHSKLDPAVEAISEAELKRFLRLRCYKGQHVTVCGCGVALFGTPPGVDILNDDPQLQRRFEQVVLPPWKRGDEANVLIHNLEVRLPLRKTSHVVADPKLVETILEKGDHVIGHIRRVMLLAARTAIQSGREVIDAKTLEDMAWVPLSERACDVIDRLEVKTSRECEPA